MKALKLVDFILRAKATHIGNIIEWIMGKH